MTDIFSHYRGGAWWDIYVDSFYFIKFVLTSRGGGTRLVDYQASDS